MSNFSDSYVLDQKNGVWSRQENDLEFNYSDGSATEERIAEIIENATDLSSGSAELAGAIVDWPTQAHLSRSRANLFRPIQGHLGGSILEIGSGCGAITRFLGECAERVTAVEGSSRRAAITASRCRDLPNVRVVCDNIQTLNIDEKYDVVTLIGVLEYSRLFMEGEDPIQAMLCYCRDFLKPDGILVIAIENQLGLKYFSGAPEDHGNPPFHGIMDLYGADSVVTFGRRELTQKIVRSGFASTSFLYPMPDYKLPGIILHDAAFDEPFDFLGMLSTPDDFRGHPGRIFADETTWPILVRNGLAQDFMNSFLVIATNSTEAVLSPEDRVHFYASERALPFQKVTHIKRDHSGLVVKRERMHEGQVPLPGKYTQIIEDEPFYAGELYISELIRIVNHVGWTVNDIAGWAKPWLEFLMSNALVKDENNHPMCRYEDPQLPQNFVDCTPFNTVKLPDNTFQTIDLEYIKEKPVLFSFVAFRGLLESLRKLKSVASSNTDTRIVRLVLKTMTLAGYPMSRKQIKFAFDSDREFREFIDSVITRHSSGRKSHIMSIYSRMSVDRRRLPMRPVKKEISVFGKITFRLKCIFRLSIKRLLRID